MIFSFKIAANPRKIEDGEDPTKIESTTAKTQNVKQIMWQQTLDVKQMSNSKPQMPSKRSKNKPQIPSKWSNEPLEQSRIKSLLSILLKGSRSATMSIHPCLGHHQYATLYLSFTPSAFKGKCVARYDTYQHFDRLCIEVSLMLH